MADQHFDVDDHSYVVDINQYDTQGFCAGFEDEKYELRRAIPVGEAYCNAGTEDLRIDWTEYIGPVQEFGSRNDLDGHWSALSLPLIIPERQYLVSYIFEYAFYHDTILESVAAAVSHAESQTLFMDNSASRSRRAISGAKQLQSKIFVGFLEGDAERVGRIVSSWERMTSTTAKREKTVLFENILDYEEYRMVDTGAYYVEAVMLWGMAMSLTEEEDILLEPIRRPCFAALGVTNDYFSFDVEYDGYLKSDGGSLTNAVFLYMKWNNCDIDTAKQMVLKEVNRLEREFLRLKRDFEAGPHGKNPKLLHWLRALSYQIPGNLVWSLRCPRYNPEYRDMGPLPEMVRPRGYGPDEETINDAAATDGMTTTTSEPRSSESPVMRPISPTSSQTSFGEHSLHYMEAKAISESDAPAQEPMLSSKKLEQAITKIAGSERYQKIQKIQDAIADSLCIWLDVDKEVAKKVKKVMASICIPDDIEDANASRFALLETLKLAGDLNHASSTAVILEHTSNICIGNDHLAQWVDGNFYPTEAQYLEMIDKKDGSVLRMLAQLLVLNQDNTRAVEFDDNFEKLMISFTRVLSILNDLTVIKAVKAGDVIGVTRLSIPLVHTLNSAANADELKTILALSRYEPLSTAQQGVLLKSMQPSLAYTMKMLATLQADIKFEINRVEHLMACKNWTMRLVLQKIMP